MKRLAEDSDDGEQVPVPFRYSVTAVKGNRTNVFRPNSLQGDAKQATAGALYMSKFDTLPQSKLVDVLWEAWCALSANDNSSQVLKP